MVEEAVGGDYLVRRDVDVVLDDLGARLGSQDAGVYVGKVPHVEEVLDRPGGRRGDHDASAVDDPAVGFVALGDLEQLMVRFAEGRPDVTEPHEGREPIVHRGRIDLGAVRQVEG